MTDAERIKSNARRLTNYYLKMGRIERKPCEKCGEPKSEKHHEDYSKPLEVLWLCRKCHRNLHIREALARKSGKRSRAIPS